MPITTMTKMDLENMIMLAISYKSMNQDFTDLEREWLEALREGTLEIEGYVKYQKLELRKKQ